MCSVSNVSVFSVTSQYVVFWFPFTSFFWLQVQCSSSDVKLNGFQNFVVLGLGYCYIWISFRFVISFAAKDIVEFTNQKDGL